MQNDYVTHTEFQNGIRDLTHEMRIMESNLSEKLANKIHDTFWKLIPIFIGLIALMNGVFFLAYKIGN